MIRFNSLENTTTPESSSLNKGDIASESIQTNESKSFWNEVFSKETNLIDEVYDCDEEDFRINFDANDNDIVDLMDEVRSSWDSLENVDKMKLCENFINVLSAKLELENPPSCKFYQNEEDGDFGFYSKADNTININTNQFNDPNETINTLAHEMRHAYQNERADIGKTYTDELYKCNLENYIGLEFVDGYCVNFFEYYNQFVEVEARAFADMFKL